VPCGDYSLVVPWGLRRYQNTQQLHFVTFSCYRRLRYLDTIKAKRLFELALEEVRRHYGMLVFGYVVMPEHVHLLLSEPEREVLSTAIRATKQSVFAKADRRARALLAGSLLRFQRVEREQDQRKASLHASKSGEERAGREAGRLAME
jgi:REP element-mobilizing transposase RayT